MSGILRGSTAWRILVELAGRDAAIAERELCETLNLEPTAAHETLRDLWLDNRVDHPPGLDSERWRITWQGQDALRRIDESADRAPARKRHRRIRISWPTAFLAAWLVAMFVAWRVAEAVAR